jgi:hypothetical protein
MFVLGQGIRRAPRMFAVAVVGSALYGVMTAGSAWALGRVTRDVITPSFRSGHADGGDLARGAALLAAVALLLVIGVIARRIAAGIVVYDLGAIFRRRGGLRLAARHALSPAPDEHGGPGARPPPEPA